MNEPEAHRRIAVEANNSTWDILAKPVAEISEEEAEEMTRRAYAAAYHWQRAEGFTPANDARAEWLLSRVWSVRGNGDVALGHARRCLAICESTDLVDFDLAYAHEAMARALACIGDSEGARQHKNCALTVEIADPQDKAQVDADISAEPWYGLEQ